MPTGAVIYKKNLLKKINGFHPFFTGYSLGEDIYMSYKIKQLAPTYIFREAKAYHEDGSVYEYRDSYNLAIMEIRNKFFLLYQVFDKPEQKYKRQLFFWLFINRLKLTVSSPSLLNQNIKFLKGYLTGYKKYRDINFNNVNYNEY